LLGGKYIKIEPGSAKNMIPPGGEVKKTKDALVLEQVLGRMIFLLTEENKTPKR